MEHTSDLWTIAIGDDLGMPMKTIKVNPVRYQILTELTKSSKFSTIENYLGDLIDSTYAKKK